MTGERENGQGGPLAGVRVLDLTSVVLGPLATQILGDYGADIVKIESPSGDLMRLNGVSRHRGMGSIFLAINRNKRSIALDLQKPEGAAVLRRLVPQTDVLVHNMRVEAIERLGFGYDAVSALNPRIVYVAATGFDQDGPDAGKPAFDEIIQAASGLAAIASIGRDAPDYVPSLIADKTAGMAVVNAVLAALFHRERSGAGQAVSVSLAHSFLAYDTWNWLLLVLADRYERAFESAPPFDTRGLIPNTPFVFRLLVALSRDGQWLQFSQTTDHLWEAFLRTCDLDAAIVTIERWRRDEQRAFAIASAFGRGSRLSLQVLDELRLLLRWLRFKRLHAEYANARAALRGVPALEAAE